MKRKKSLFLRAAAIAAVVLCGITYVGAQITPYSPFLNVTNLALNGIVYGQGGGPVKATAQGAANTVLTANAGAPVFSATPTVAGVGIVNQALTDGATISWNVASGSFATVTLAGNRTLAAPTNLLAGSHYVLVVTQDGTGGRTLAFNAVFKGLFGAGVPNPNNQPSTATAYTFESDGTNLYVTNVAKAPTETHLTSGSAQTYTTPTGVVWIRVRGTGGGGGGAGSGVGGAATASSFGGLTANGGAGGTIGGNASGAAATATGCDINIAGDQGQAANTGLVNTFGAAGHGGNSRFGGAGSAGSGSAGPTAGVASATNSGSGGGGGAAVSGSAPGGGGGAGAYCESLITFPAATFTYTVGPAGSAGASNANVAGGGAGSAGRWDVEEHYNF